MNQHTSKVSRPSFFADSRASIFVCLLSFTVFLYYFLGKIVLADVYRVAVVGAIYELLWLPMLVLLIVVPVGAILILTKKNNKKPLAVISILFYIGAMIVLFI
jgi:hypothetical protein